MSHLGCAIDVVDCKIMIFNTKIRDHVFMGYVLILVNLNRNRLRILKTFITNILIAILAKFK